MTACHRGQQDLLSRTVLRERPVESDLLRVDVLLESTGVSYPFERTVALELVEDRLRKGEESEYSFFFADHDEELAGYICYGPISMTQKRYDIYWIAVSKKMGGRGIGSLLLSKAEEKIMSEGGLYVFVETSSRDDYAPARKLYGKCSFQEVACIPSFYADNDNKIVFMKSILK